MLPPDRSIDVIAVAHSPRAQRRVAHRLARRRPPAPDARTYFVCRRRRSISSRLFPFSVSIIINGRAYRTTLDSTGSSCRGATALRQRLRRTSASSRLADTMLFVLLLRYCVAFTIDTRIVLSLVASCDCDCDLDSFARHRPSEGAAELVSLLGQLQVGLLSLCYLFFLSVCLLCQNTLRSYLYQCVRAMRRGPPRGLIVFGGGGWGWVLNVFDVSSFVCSGATCRVLSRMARAVRYVLFL